MSDANQDYLPAIFQQNTNLSFTNMDGIAAYLKNSQHRFDWGAVLERMHNNLRGGLFGSWGISAIPVTEQDPESKMTPFLFGDDRETNGLRLTMLRGYGTALYSICHNDPHYSYNLKGFYNSCQNLNHIAEEIPASDDSDPAYVAGAYFAFKQFLVQKNWLQPRHSIDDDAEERAYKEAKVKDEIYEKTKSNIDLFIEITDVAIEEYNNPPPTIDITPS